MKNNKSNKVIRGKDLHTYLKKQNEIRKELEYKNLPDYLVKELERIEMSVGVNRDTIGYMRSVCTDDVEDVIDTILNSTCITLESYLYLTDKDITELDSEGIMYFVRKDSLPDYPHQFVTFGTSGYQVVANGWLKYIDDEVFRGDIMFVNRLNLFRELYDVVTDEDKKEALKTLSLTSSIRHNSPMLGEYIHKKWFNKLFNSCETERRRCLENQVLFDRLTYKQKLKAITESPWRYFYHIKDKSSLDDKFYYDLVISSLNHDNGKLLYDVWTDEQYDVSMIPEDVIGTLLAIVEKHK